MSALGITTETRSVTHMLRVMAVDEGFSLFGSISLGHFCAKWTINLR